VIERVVYTDSVVQKKLKSVYKDNVQKKRMSMIARVLVQNTINTVQKKRKSMIVRVLEQHTRNNVIERECAKGSKEHDSKNTCEIIVVAGE